MDNKKRAHHISAPISPNNNNYHHLVDDLTADCTAYPPPPAYQPSSFQNCTDKSIRQNQSCGFYYHSTPPPQTVIIYRQPARSKDACCWGCLAALCLCFGAKECCS
ncbi:uncharacterized protein BX663DRAFT_502343 [Cokeromyces recurvatus]|uniref:uncharacterized protein n=1 Tax=Cokeromyces recurvatus TaxID=90255 RepID=UPI00221F8E7F|nr:uncharacterized protein BX663DRAFT_502343 [Cokeromyces recurvatus]KAI7905285.1 hypothetical protein BX663DRAFT_502343 [Cokeromyces recurvatus]